LIDNPLAWSRSGENPGDIPAIRGLNRQAFEQDQEADIVDALRANRGSP